MDFASPTAVREGIALSEEGLSPYAGDIFHEVIMLHTLGPSFANHTHPSTLFIIHALYVHM